METVVYTVAFHGGTEIVERPEIGKGPRNLDFGAGFYTTQSREQAARWAERQRKVRGLTTAIVNKYDISGLWTAGLSCKVFSGATSAVRIRGVYAGGGLASAQDRAAFQPADVQDRERPRVLQVRVVGRGRGGETMSEKRFSAILFLLVSDLIKRLVAGGEDARSAIRAFYRSRLYELLGNRETGLWHASTDMLLELYAGERKTGTVNLDWCI